jgi:hypothetical protein
MARSTKSERSTKSARSTKSKKTKAQKSPRRGPTEEKTEEYERYRAIILGQI